MTPVLLCLGYLAIALDPSNRRLVIWLSISTMISAIHLFLPGLELTPKSGFLTLFAAVLILLVPKRNETSFLLSVVGYASIPLVATATTSFMTVYVQNSCLIVLIMILAAFFLFALSNRGFEPGGIVPGVCLGFAAIIAWPGSDTVSAVLFNGVISVCLMCSVVSMFSALRRAPDPALP